MPGQFDASLKHLLEEYPQDWARLVGVPEGVQVTAANADLSTVSPEADKLLRVHAEPPWLSHLELQASYEANLGQRVLRYNVLADGHHSLPVESVVMLLRREADGPRITGRVERRVPGKPRHLDFHYHVIRLWEIPAERVLQGGTGTLPLVPLCDVPESGLRETIRKMERRINAELPPGEAEALWTATYVLMGLCYTKSLTVRLMQGVLAMKESVTYQAILEEGRDEIRAEASAKMRGTLFALGRKRFGEPDPGVRARIEAIHDLDRLAQLGSRVLDVESWSELLS